MSRQLTRAIPSGSKNMAVHQFKYFFDLMLQSNELQEQFPNTFNLI